MWQSVTNITRKCDSRLQTLQESVTVSYKHYNKVWQSDTNITRKCDSYKHYKKVGQLQTLQESVTVSYKHYKKVWQLHRLQESVTVTNITRKCDRYKHYNKVWQLQTSQVSVTITNITRKCDSYKHVRVWIPVLSKLLPGYLEVFIAVRHLYTLSVTWELLENVLFGWFVDIYFKKVLIYFKFLLLCQTFPMHFIKPLLPNHWTDCEVLHYFRNFGHLKGPSGPP